VPTAVLPLSPASNWQQLKNKCESSACDTANGGCTIALSNDFAMGLYTAEIVFTAKTLTIWGQGRTLDASGDSFCLEGGRFFFGNANGLADSSLVLHDVVLKNGCTSQLSNGGAIWATGANAKPSLQKGPDVDVEIHDSTFQSNTASYGGAIYASGGAVVTIHGSTFISNSASYVSATWCCYCYQGFL
jgi:predicted outer membrane repeat protein